MPVSSIQESGTAAQVAVQGYRRSPRDPRVEAGGAHRPTRARATGVLPWPDSAPSSEPVRGDEDLAREINTEHDLLETHKRNTIQHAIRRGELLLEMKRRVGHGNWLAWVEEHFEASERTARNYMEIAKSATAADLQDDTTMRSALRTLASRSQSKDPKTSEQADIMPANGRVPVEDDAHISGTDAFEAPRAGLGKTHQRTWANVPPRRSTIKRVFSEAAGDQLDDHSAGEVLYESITGSTPCRDRPGAACRSA